MKITKYFLLIRDSFPCLNKDGKPYYHWVEENSGPLKQLRKEESIRRNEGRKTKIIREETNISVVKRGELK